MSEITDLHKPFAQWLERAMKPIYCVNPRSDQRSTINAGHPDFTLSLNSHVLYIEFKTDKGRLSTAQKQRIAQIEASGCRVHVIRDMDSAIRIVTEWRDAVGQVREVTTPKKETLFLLGGAVWREVLGLGFIRVREATAADMGLPTL